jgi:hypothetical protein
MARALQHRLPHPMLHLPPAAAKLSSSEFNHQAYRRRLFRPPITAGCRLITMKFDNLEQNLQHLRIREGVRVVVPLSMIRGIPHLLLVLE